MKVYILDWSGTLDQMEDSLAFVQKLNARGDATIFWSGGCCEHSQKIRFDKTRAACTYTEGKGNFNMTLRALGGVPGAWYRLDDIDPKNIEEIVVSDDGFDASPEMMGFYKKCAGGIPVRYVKPCDLSKEA